MIQRIQTLYLAAAAALAVFLIRGPIIKLIDKAGQVYELNPEGIFFLKGDITAGVVEKSLPLTIIIYAVPVLFILAIFLFKRRKLQIRVTVFATLLSIGSFLLMLYYIFYTGKKLEADMVFNIKLVFPVVSAILGYLAFRNILKDELLIKSYDRIR